MVCTWASNAGRPLMKPSRCPPRCRIVVSSRTCRDASEPTAARKAWASSLFGELGVVEGGGIDEPADAGAVGVEDDDAGGGVAVGPMSVIRPRQAGLTGDPRSGGRSTEAARRADLLARSAQRFPAPVAADSMTAPAVASHCYLLVPIRFPALVLRWHRLPSVLSELR